MLPLNFKLYLRKEVLGLKAKRLFKNKQKPAMFVTDDFASVTEINYLLIDA
ncbi:hypothetical protein CFSAN001628_017669 [Clostridium botulinum CFSAN001628]|uniref:Uncharacterized protein n=2 Tax=Clostridium botulinum TaxID=1491 RepID=A7GH54_CLOBL|nr:hypothetical protein CLI_2886 [Clostridium botulinum F str. Langeland]ACA45878.1 transposase, IS4 [Clostridium botulinum B1 str. Okra]ADG00496.1 hypothetical protein CBF_2878 [Clostridium botulinum F str. 230613]EKX78697.1 hypothetical protein CFSAN001628_017669 [Clostridium botulinum CFSAN001628]